MKAVVLAGGRGVRLAPYTTYIPKPLVPVGDEITLIDVMLRQLCVQGFDEVFLALGHMGHLVRSFVGDGSRWGLTLTCWDECDSPGSVDPLLDHLDELPDHFVVAKADILCDLDMGALLREHVAGEATLTMATYSRSVQIDFDVLDIAGGRLHGVEEKPDVDVEVAMGVYVMSRRLLEGRTSGSVGFDELLRRMLADGSHPAIHHFDGYWLDIGRPEDYLRANVDFPSIRDRFLDPQRMHDTGEAEVVIDLTTAREASLVDPFELAGVGSREGERERRRQTRAS